MILFRRPTAISSGSTRATGEPVPTFGRQRPRRFQTGHQTTDFQPATSACRRRRRSTRTCSSRARACRSRPLSDSAGDTRAWDLRTGKMVWQFHHVPRPGEAGNDTWESDSWKNSLGREHVGLHQRRSRARARLPADRISELRLLRRRSQGRESLRELDRGARRRDRQAKWHFQAIRHDTWDFDFTAAPVLIDVMTKRPADSGARARRRSRGSSTSSIAATGKPIFGMEERAVPPSDVPGERQNWPTQPVSGEAEAGLASGLHAVRSSPSSRRSTRRSAPRCSPPKAACSSDGPFTRYNTTLSIQFPGTLGASNWHGASYNPSLGLLFVNVLSISPTSAR